MKNIKRKITLSVLGTMLLVFASLLAVVNIFIPQYLTAEAKKAILSEEDSSEPFPYIDTANVQDNADEHFLTPSVRYLEIEGELSPSPHQ